MVHKPIILIIRDGWGYREAKEFNATILGNIPFTKMLMQNYPNTLLDASGEAVGLPEGYQGNSEVGHMTIGAGRIFFQSLPRINKDIKNGEFFKNKAFIQAVNNCKKNKSTMHILGILQKSGVHGHIDHCIALLDLCKKEGLTDVVVHIISDGRDASVTETLKNTRLLIDHITFIGLGKVATISGRYYAMDRDKKWDRTKLAYDCIAKGETSFTFDDPIKCLEECYANNETDEFIKPRKASWYSGIKKNDSVMFYNFRTDRTRQLTMSLIEENFEGWQRTPLDIYFVAMTEFYAPMDKHAHIAYTPEPVVNLLGDVISQNGLSQLRISETEKYAHVTFFFNGQFEQPTIGEDRILIPSPKVATYDLKPEMSINELGDKIVEEIQKDKYDVIITNFVNADMVGHTGVWNSILKAVKSVDDNIKKVVDETLSKNGTVLISADHGCCEDKTDAFKTSHTTNKVPFILVTNDTLFKNVKLKDGKGLQDIAPTILKLLNIKKPIEMTGESII